MEEEAEKLKEMQGEVEKQMMSTKTSMVLHDMMPIHRATVHDVITHRNQCKIHFRMARQPRSTNMCHT